jgi:nicotinate-nucleotide pyrophosphorylase (carboxylating)
LHALVALGCCSIPASTQATATFLAKADGVLAGLAVANMVCEMVDPSLNITWSLHGDYHSCEAHSWGYLLAMRHSSWKRKG